MYSSSLNYKYREDLIIFFFLLRYVHLFVCLYDYSWSTNMLIPGNKINKQDRFIGCQFRQSENWYCRRHHRGRSFTSSIQFDANQINFTAVRHNSELHEI